MTNKSYELVANVQVTVNEGKTSKRYSRRNL